MANNKRIKFGDERQKFKKAFEICRDVAEKMSTMPDDIFNHMLLKIKKLNDEIDQLSHNEAESENEQGSIAVQCSESSERINKENDVIQIVLKTMNIYITML